MKTVVLISANAEWRSLRSLTSQAETQPSPFGEWFSLPVASENVLFFHGGWGKISAAASAQYVIDHFSPHLLVNLGTCGGFEGLVEPGVILLVEKTIVYDILEQMGDPDQAIADYSTVIDLSWLPPERPAKVRQGLLVSGDRDILAADIPTLAGRFGAVAADWESGAIAWVAARSGVRLLILRGISDVVGPRGGEAYGNLELFEQRTDDLMRRLLDDLDGWIAAAAQSS